MLSFLLSLNKKHGNYIYKAASMLCAACICIWGFDVQNIFPSGVLPPNQKWVFRLLLTLITVAIYFASLLILTLYYFKKDTEPDIAQRLLAAQKRVATLQPQKPEPFFQNNLYWLPNDNNAYCPSCYGKDKKLVPMVVYPYQATESSTVNRFRCATFPTCKFHTDIVPPPKDNPSSNDFDAALARLNKLSKPSEPASASSEPGPDDYHAKRRSFFH